MINKLPFFVRQVLPLVYDETLTFYELACKIVFKLNEVIDLTNDVAGSITTEVERILQEFKDSGELNSIIINAISDVKDDVEEVKASLEAEITARETAISNERTARENAITAKGNELNNTINREVDILNNSINLVSTFATEIADNLTPSVTTLEHKITLAEVKNWKGKEIVFFGDSWTAGTGATTTAGRFTAIIAKALEMVEVNLGVGGARFTPGSLTIAGQIDGAESSMSLSRRQNVPLVLITGGVNDIRHVDTYDRQVFLDEVRNTCSKAHDVFPNALIILAMGNTCRGRFSETIFHWYEMAKRHAGYGINYPLLILPNVYNYIRSRTEYYGSDNLHPTNIGHAVFAQKIVNGILGGDTSCQFLMDSPTLTLEGASWTTRPYILMDGNYAHFSPCNISLSSAISANTSVGTYDGNATPKTNVYMPVYRGNYIVGTFAIVPNGHMYLCPNSGTSITGGFIPGASWFIIGDGEENR